MAPQKQLPEFIQQRLDLFINDLIDSNNNGKHLVLGKRPSTNDIILQVMITLVYLIIRSLRLT